MDLRENYKKKIEEIPNTSFNKDQKELAIKILGICEEKDLENIYKLLVRRVKTGFVFDSAPSSNNQSIALLQHNEKLSLNDLNKKRKPFDEQGLTNDNLLIIGENYDALKNLLLVYRNKIDIIYIDPPYNTDASINEKNNYSEDEIKEKSSTKFVYRDKFSRTGWLNMMQDRLYLAKDLLSEEGVIFVSIDDREQAYLKVLMDEIFGEENFISDLVWLRNPGGESDNKHIAKTKDFILFYAKNKNLFEINDLKKEIDILDFKKDKNGNLYKKGSMLEKSGENDRLIDRPNLGYVIYYHPKLTPSSKKIWIQSDAYDKLLINENLTINQKIYEFDENLIKEGWIPITPREIKGTYGRWRQGEKTFLNNFYQNKYIFEKSKNDKWRIYEKEIVETDEPYKKLKPKDFISFTTNSKGTKILKLIFGDENWISDFKPKPVDLIKYLTNFHLKKDSVVLDFFAGSGTTAQAVMELNEEDNGNRKFILVTNNAEIIKDKKPTGKFIATDITYEKLHRITKGVGTKGEKDFAWIKERKETPYKTNNLKVLDIVYKDTTIHSDWNEIKEEVKKSFRLLDENFKIQDEDFVYKLSSLHPYREEEDK